MIADLLREMKPIPVTLDLEKHILMLPSPNTTLLDQRSDALRFRELSAFDKDTWACTGSSIAVAVLEKVTYKRLLQTFLLHQFFKTSLQDTKPLVLAPKRANKNKDKGGDGSEDRSTIKVTIFYGARIYNHIVFIDSKTGGMSKRIGTVKLTLPITRESLEKAASDALLSSANRCDFSNDFHNIVAETIDQANSHACKPGKDKLLPICIPVQETYRVADDEHKPDHLNIVIYRKDQVESMGSYSAGSHGEDKDADKLSRAFDAFAAGLTMEYLTNKPPKYMHGLTPRSGLSRERSLEVFKELGRLAYDLNPLSSSSSKFPTATDIIARIKVTIDCEDRNQQLADQLPPDVLVNGFTRSASATHPQTAQPPQNKPSPPPPAAAKAPDDVLLPGQSYVTTRADDLSVSTDRHTIKWLDSIQQSLGGLQVQLAEDCGKGAYKEGDWFRLLAVYVVHASEPKANESFLVQDSGQNKQKIIKWKHFLKTSSNDVADLLLDSDDD